VLFLSAPFINFLTGYRLKKNSKIHFLLAYTQKLTNVMRNNKLKDKKEKIFIEILILL